jgi:ElaB/YqjD/DUF883 family membrane-anchored ribosome-binding protein
MSITSDLQTTGKNQYKNMKDTVSDSGVSYDKIADQVKDSATVMQKKAKEYSDIAADYAKENPLYIALGAVGVGFLLGALITRSRR